MQQGKEPHYSSYQLMTHKAATRLYYSCESQHNISEEILKIDTEIGLCNLLHHIETEKAIDWGVL